MLFGGALSVRPSVLEIERTSCPYGAENSEVAPRLSEDSWTPALLYSKKTKDEERRACRVN
jgi:hypothetical protein